MRPFSKFGAIWRKMLGVIPVPPPNYTPAGMPATTVALLLSKAGVKFDKVYIQHEIVFHESVIDAIKGALLPAIRNEDIRALVIQALAGLEHHPAETEAVAKKPGVEQRPCPNQDRGNI